MASRVPGLTFSGPFFTRDVQATVRQNIRLMLEGMVKEGEAAVRDAMPHVSGATAAGVVGRTKALTGKQWALSGVISQQREFPWMVHRSGRSQAIYRGGKLEASQHQFRRVASGLNRSKAVAAADLVRGLN